MAVVGGLIGADEVEVPPDVKLQRNFRLNWLERVETRIAWIRQVDRVIWNYETNIFGIVVSGGEIKWMDV